MIDGKTGFTLAPQSTRNPNQYLAKLMASDELRQQMGQASLAHAKAQFGLDNMLDKMEKIFINAISLKDKSR